MPVSAGASEDLKNKLAAVIVNAELALRLEGDAARERMQRIIDAAWAANALLAQAADLPRGASRHDDAPARPARPGGNTVAA